MGDMTDEICDRCGADITVSIEYFQRAMKEGEPILCEECYGILLDEQTEAMPKRCFEYKSIMLPVDDIEFDQHGRDGWELVSVDNGIAYFKREYMKEG